MKIATAVALASLAVPTALAQTPGNPKRAPNLSCSFIAEQCLRGCAKEAPRDFCEGYCARTRADCIETGKWTGLRRRYTGVQRR